MSVLPRGLAALLLVPILLCVCGFTPTPTTLVDVPVIVTSAPVYSPLAALRSGERFPQGAQLLLVQHGRSAPLVEGFSASADASVSFDGKRVLFSGRKSRADHWAVWELTLEGHALRKVISDDADLIRPLYLPENRFVYARRTIHGFQMVAAHFDGAGVLPLTYTGASTLPQTVLADGRILFEAPFPLGTSIEQGATPELFLVYSDGSGVESYRCDHGSARWGGTQLASGDVILTHGSSLARFTSPSATEVPLSAPRAEFDGTVAELPSSEWLVSARSTAAGAFALSLWKPGRPLLRKLLERGGENLIEPVVVTAHERPHYHPSALHPWDYANLLALDARISRDGPLSAAPVKVSIESQDENGNAVALGTAPVESDGSFFIEAPGDKPIRFVLLDQSGATLRREHGWFWIRKGEQRYCVGCHAGPEHAPENRVPQVLLHTTVPVDLTGAGQPAAPGGH